MMFPLSCFSGPTTGHFLRGRSLKGRCNIRVYVPVCVPVSVPPLNSKIPPHTPTRPLNPVPASGPASNCATYPWEELPLKKCPKQSFFATIRNLPLLVNSKPIVAPRSRQYWLQLLSETCRILLCHSSRCHRTPVPAARAVSCFCARNALLSLRSSAPSCWLPPCFRSVFFEAN